MTAATHPTVDFTGLARHHRAYRASLLRAMAAALDTKQPVDGPSVRELERRCAQVTGRRHARACASGTDALYLALRAAGVGPGHEVVVTGFSFIASATPILLVGATPVFVDVNPHSQLMDLDMLGQAISAETRAIIAVDLFGRCLPQEPLESFAAHHGLMLIEDAAQAFSARDEHHIAGSLGHLSTVSFDPLKVVGGVTTGGMVLTDDPYLAERVRLLSCHGYNLGTATFDLLGINSRMSSLNAAVVLHELDFAEDRRTARSAVADTYRAGLSDLGFLALPAPYSPTERPNHHKFVIRVSERDRLRAHLRAHGVETKIHYAAALPDHAPFRGICRTVGALPHARRAAGDVLSLPIYADLTDEETTHVVTMLREWRP